MAIPNKVTGACNGSTAQDVLRVTFSTALSAAPVYEMWDSASAAPAVGELVSTANGCFSSSPPMYSLVDTTSGAPSSSWVPGSATAGTANPNRMKGSTNFVTATATPGAGGTIRFNMCVTVPTAATVSTNMAADLLIRCQHTGAPPTLTWEYREGGAWVAFTPGTHALRFSRASTPTGGPYYVSIPGSGTQDAAELWVTT